MSKLFENISIQEKNRLLKILEATTSSFTNGTNITPTQKSDYIGFIEKGKVQIIKTDYNGNRFIIEELIEGEVFGSTISSASSEDYRFISKGSSVVTFIDLDRISEGEILRQSFYVQFMKNIIHTLTNIANEKNERIDILVKKTIRERLLEYFKIISTKKGSRTVRLPFSYTDLADYLAVDRTAMYRELAHLKEEKLIKVNGRIITLLYKADALYLTT